MKTYAFLLSIWCSVWMARGQLPGTALLEPEADFSASMVAGIDRMALRLIEESKQHRQPTREQLAAILGVVDERVPFQTLELVGTIEQSAMLAETATARVYRIRWPVFERVHGEGIYLQPKGRPLARVIMLPDADEQPEALMLPFWLTSGCEVIVSAPISRGTEWSTNERFGVKTNLTHREWIYRQSYELGRHIQGYEIQKALALVDWCKAQPVQVPVLLAGRGEGGLIALRAAAMDERIDSVFSAGAFAPRESVWQEPIDRNVFGLLRDFGDAEVASLIAPRPLVLQHHAYPVVLGPPEVRAGQRQIAAPGALLAPSEREFQAEIDRLRKIAPQSRLHTAKATSPLAEIMSHLLPKAVASAMSAAQSPSQSPLHLQADAGRQKRLVRELEDFTQRLLVSAEAERKQRFWDKLPLDSVTAFESHMKAERERFWKEVIGRLPDPNVPMNARSRWVRETARVKIYEVTLEVWQDVFAWSWLCLPKTTGSAPLSRRPVVICQHGLEGLPEDTLTTDATQKSFSAYQAFALRLAEAGYVTLAPHNPYRGQDAFRTLQRKLNPLGLSLFSVINGQHQRLLEWLKTQPFTQPDKIAFYGLSYGGKTAMRTPAVLPDYCLSICSGDFNEWVRKCVSTDMPMSYLHTHEYEIWEWNLGRTFNYAEMAALIAPRPFLVERGHEDGVGLDEWVNYEFAKVRRLYDKLKLGDRAVIEHFDGPHRIHRKGSFEFLKTHLGSP